MKRLLTTAALLMAAINLAFGQPLTENQTKAAQHCLNMAIREANKSLPVTIAGVTTDSLKVDGDILEYFVTITDSDTSSNFSEDASSLINTLQNRNSLIYSLAADLGMGMENFCRNTDQAADYSVKVSNEDLKNILGGELSRETRKKAVTDYLSGDFSRNFSIGIEISVGDKEIGLLRPYNVKLKDFYAMVDKNYFIDIIKHSYATGDATSMLYDMCIYAGMNFTGYLKFKDQVVISSVPYSQIVKASQEGIAAFVPDAEEAFHFNELSQKPLFQGHDANTFSNWVNGHLRYPKEAKENGIQGRVFLNMTIDTDGTVSNVTVIRGPDPDLIDEAVRVVKMSPKWTPGMIDDKPVKVTYTFSVVFQLK